MNWRLVLKIDCSHPPPKKNLPPLLSLFLSHRLCSPPPRHTHAHCRVRVVADCLFRYISRFLSVSNLSCFYLSRRAAPSLLFLLFVTCPRSSLPFLLLPRSLHSAAAQPSTPSSPFSLSLSYCTAAPLQCPPQFPSFLGVRCHPGPPDQIRAADDCFHPTFSRPASL